MDAWDNVFRLLGLYIHTFWHALDFIWGDVCSMFRITDGLYIIK